MSAGFILELSPEPTQETFSSRHLLTHLGQPTRYCPLTTSPSEMELQAGRCAGMEDTCWLREDLPRIRIKFHLPGYWWHEEKRRLEWVPGLLRGVRIYPGGWGSWGTPRGPAFVLTLAEVKGNATTPPSSVLDVLSRSYNISNSYTRAALSSHETSFRGCRQSGHHVRASVQCEKVRCNLQEYGPPCTNCRLDQVECTALMPKRRSAALGLF